MATTTEPKPFVAQDFAAYEDRRQRDAEYNGFRLIVRRKLDAYGKAAVQDLKREKGLDLTGRTSLNHPHATNQNRVSSQLVYLSRSAKDKKALGAIVGPVLSKDVDTHYIQTTLGLQIDAQGAEQALRIHKLAFWDGLNLKNRVKNVAEMDLLGDILNSMPGSFVLLMDNWKKEYRCGEIAPEELSRYFTTYQPGEHWLHVRRRFPIEFAASSEFMDTVRDGFRSLADFYAFATWSNDNNCLFDADGRMIR
ncbi:MAG: hypothetical protein KDC95_04085 [Planctomycetes bacterium]|nr:hypothetical protein [Planctomycetota bacterium]